MIPHTPTPDWAISCMRRITKFDDPDVLNAALELVTVLSGLNDSERDLPERSGRRVDAARAAADYGYRKTEDCDRHCEEYLSIIV